MLMCMSSPEAFLTYMRAGGTAVLRSFASGGGNEADDMHDDFKPQFKAQRSGSVEDAIRHDVATNRVLLYMKVRCLLWRCVVAHSRTF